MSELELFTLLEGTPDAAFTVTNQGEICSWNKAAEKLFGYSAADALNKTCHSILQGHGPLGNEIWGENCSIRHCAEKRLEIPNFDPQMKVRSGGRMWVSVSTLVFENSRNHRRLIVHLAHREGSDAADDILNMARGHSCRTAVGGRRRFLVFTSYSAMNCRKNFFAGAKGSVFGPSNDPGSARTATAWRAWHARPKNLRASATCHLGLYIRVLGNLLLWRLRRTEGENVMPESVYPPASPDLARKRREQCPYCIKSHTIAATKHGATPQEIMEAIWVAAEMRAGGAYAHSIISLATMNAEQQRHEP